jgi:hypothetical protein
MIGSFTEQLVHIRHVLAIDIRIYLVFVVPFLVMDLLFLDSGRRRFILAIAATSSAAAHLAFIFLSIIQKRFSLVVYL